MTNFLYGRIVADISLLASIRGYNDVAYMKDGGQNSEEVELFCCTEADDIERVLRNGYLSKFLTRTLVYE